MQKEQLIRPPKPQIASSRIGWMVSRRDLDVGAWPAPHWRCRSWALTAHARTVPVELWSLIVGTTPAAEKRKTRRSSRGRADAWPYSPSDSEGEEAAPARTPTAASRDKQGKAARAKTPSARKKPAKKAAAQHARARTPKQRRPRTAAR